MSKLVISSITISSEQKSKIKNILNNYNFLGNATIYSNGERLWNYTTANTLNTSYLINSVQKSLTAGLLMQQVRDGKISLTDKLSKYYSEIPNSDKITIMNLLEMTSGLSQVGNLGTHPFVSDDANVLQVIKSIIYNKNNFDKWNYQDVNYVIISHILEKITDRSYESLYDDMYVKRLRLTNTHFMWSNNKDIAPKKRKFDMDETHGLLGAGSIAMSNDDLYKVISSLLNGTLLSMDEKKLIYAPGNNSTSYRGGLYNRERYYSSNGAGYGYYSFIRISKDGKNAVVLQTNSGKNYSESRDNAMKIFNLIFD